MKSLRRRKLGNRFKFRKLVELMEISLFSATIGVLPGSTAAQGQDSTQQMKALDAIETAADRFCQTVPVEQANSGTKLTAQGKAQFNGLIGKIADLGVVGSAEHSSNQSRGVLQKDLAGAITESNNCKLHVLQILDPALLGTGPGAPEPNPTTQPRRDDSAPAPETLKPATTPPTLSDSKSYWAIPVPSRVGGTIPCEVLTSLLDQADQNRVLTYLGATLQASPTRPECALEILSIDLSQTSGAGGCSAREATLRYRLHGSTGAGAPPRSVQYSECYGAEGSETDLKAIRGAISELVALGM